MSRLMVIFVIGLLSCNGSGQSKDLPSRPNPAQPGIAMPNSQPEKNLVGTPDEPKNLHKSGPPPPLDASAD
jgi:hypothetical protein